ncbi:uncharacterized protein PHACADRAFT_213794 [Phanerochaete carnosa HHB-10118-sp]|uniref:Zn(2)-C6 fungal-type domain-containing protein n=1 Tax=Phanerochaete carnosa (strain HHB-10118-sp) TaxID=650164 RepID=K5VFS2_PHACS|nr:uncharacterized protein PHACADRAFT_213794 [Phanerochaete carnosa HHB-10118-sp]EKM50023.1 hypothetical protein PHACADRAFT_213794 [Phanerochaete carnosa HHB-10118-sp]
MSLHACFRLPAEDIAVSCFINLRPPGRVADHPVPPKLRVSERTAMPPAPSLPPQTLERGKAYLRCRKRKMRCDGVRPTCTQCTKANIAADCEYSDAGPTTSQILERNIAELEARIVEILKGRPADPVSLRAPYSGPSTSKTNKITTKKADALIPTSLSTSGPIYPAEPYPLEPLISPRGILPSPTLPNYYNPSSPSPHT